MDLIDIVGKVIEISRKKEEFSDEVSQLRSCVLTLKDAVEKIGRFGAIPSDQELFVSIQAQLKEALKELEDTPREMTLIQKTLSLLPGNMVERIKDRTKQLIQYNSLLQTHLQTLILTAPGESAKLKKQREDLAPTLLEDCLGPTLEDHEFDHKGVQLEIKVTGKPEFLQEFERKGEPLTILKAISFEKDKQVAQAFEMGRLKLMFLQEKFPNEVNRISKQHFQVQVQRVRLTQVFQTCKEEIAEEEGGPEPEYQYILRVEVKSSNGCYCRSGEGEWRRLNKGQNKRLANGDQLAISMVRPANKEALFAYRFTLIH